MIENKSIQPDILDKIVLILITKRRDSYSTKEKDKFPSKATKKIEKLAVKIYSFRSHLTKENFSNETLV